MHYHIEILMPPTDDVEGAVENALAIYGENEDDAEANCVPTWWDWYEIGGAWLKCKPVGSLGLRHITRLHETPKDMTCARFLVVGTHDGEPEDVRFMVSKDIWNGTNHEKTTWDGTVGHALELLAAHDDCGCYKPEWLEKQKPNGDWLVVTVDAHN